MKVFIFEYVCGGGFQGDSPPPDLLRQGREMLQAALRDFSRLPDPVQVYTLVEERFALDLPEGVQRRSPGASWHDAWRNLVRHCDAVLVVAPESERQLERLCTEVLEEGRKSLNCSLDAIRLAADKWALNRRLQAAGIPAVDTQVWSPAGPLPPRGVIKPRYGAGCEETFVLDAGSNTPVLDPENPWVWQPWAPGEAVSLSLLAGGREVEVLSCNRIHCESQEGRLHVHGIETGGFDGNLRFREAAQVVASQVMAAVPGLRGYVGVDGMWEEQLGVAVEIVQVEWATYLDDLHSRKFQAFAGLGWQADYPDPQDFLDILFHTESETNHGAYSNAEVDTILEDARIERDGNKRVELYNRAEQMIIDDAAWVPLWYEGESHVLIKPHIKDYRLLPMTIPKFRYVYFDYDN